MRIKTIITIIAGFIFAIASPFVAIAVNETPHNASKTVSCGNCHGKALLYSPFWGGSYTPANIDDTVYNKICLECHTQPSGPYTTTGAPLARTHSSLATDNGYGNWTRECRDCHNPHYQKQSLYKRTDASNLYLATGTITSCGAYNSVNNTTTLTYSGITYKSGWDSAKLLEKTGSYRRTMLVPNVGKFGYNYPVTAIDATTITVEGDATAAYQYISPPTTFAVMYGQYIKDLINVSGTNKTVKFLDKTGTKSFADGDTTYDGVCEVCHTQTTHFRNNGGGSDPNHANIGGAGGTNCISCHTHPEGFKASCNACHGFPPIDNSGSPDGLVWVLPVTGSVTAGAHNLHVNTKSYQCDTCHYQNITQNKHNKDPRVITLGFYMFSGAYQGGSYDGQSGLNYNTTTTTPVTTVANSGAKTCSSLYCHGGTMAPNGGTASAIWDVPASAACGTCHGASTGAPPQRGSHPKHAGSASGGRQLVCTVCHKGYTSVHVNGSANWAYDTTTYSWLTGAKYKNSASGSATPVPSASYGTCSNLYCHSNVQTSPPGSALTYATPAWGGAALSCSDCHKGNTTSPNLIDSGSHTKHVSDYGARFKDCSTCHTGAGTNTTKHADYSIDVSISATYGGTYSGTSAPGNAYGSCSNNYCHSNGTATPVYSNPTWGDAASGACGTCHGVLAATPPASTPHTKHVGSTGYKYSCSKCHDSVANATADSTTQPTIKDALLHVDKIKQVSFDTFNTGGSYSGGNCNNIYCHSKGTGGTSNPGDTRPVNISTPPSWSGTTTCGSCHGGGSANGKPEYENNSPKANNHAKHSTDCSVCHYGTTTTGTIIADRTKHVNKLYDLQAKTGYSFSYSYNANGGSCSNISCHYNGSAQWGATLTCSSCHGFPPNTNAHYAHTDAAGGGLLTQSYGNTEIKSNATNYAFGCGNCHPTNPNLHANGAVEISLNPSDGGVLKSKNDLTAYRAGTGGATVCNKIYCHSNGAGGSGSNLTTAASDPWGTPRTANKCGQCHGNPPQYASAGAGVAGANSHYNSTGFMGKEGGHMITIHTDNIYNKVSGSGLLTTGTTVDNSHGNAGVATTMACYVCHSGITGKTAGTPGDLIDTYAMSGTSSSFKCSVCHTSSTTTKLQNGSITDKSVHINGSVNVVFAPVTVKSKAQLRTASIPAGWTRSGTYGASGSYDSTSAALNSGTWTPATKTCTVACHNGNSILWGDTTATCLNCHNKL